MVSQVIVNDMEKQIIKSLIEILYKNSKINKKEYQKIIKELVA